MKKAAWALAGSFALMITIGAAGTQVPLFEPDPLWSQALPNKWVTGAVGALAVDMGLAAPLAGLRLAAAQGNPEAAKLQNPVPPSPESIAAGKQAFTRYCANCHGLNAEGGPGNDLTPPAPDLTDKEWKHGSTDGEIFNSIKNGIAPDFNMGAFGDQLRDEDIWKVVNYLRSLAKK